MAKQKYTVREQDRIDYYTRSFTVGIGGLFTLVWYDEDDGVASCCECQTQNYQHSRSCPHARAVKRLMDKESPKPKATPEPVVVREVKPLNVLRMGKYGERKVCAPSTTGGKLCGATFEGETSQKTAEVVNCYSCASTILHAKRIATSRIDPKLVAEIEASQK